MGYGESKAWWYKAIVGCLYALPFLVIGFNPWVAVIPAVFIILFWLSNKSGFFANMFVWKIVEFCIGIIIGIAAAYFVRSNEILMIACMGTGGILFAIGGTGYKWARRYVMPILLTVFLWLGLH